MKIQILYKYGALLGVIAPILIFLNWIIDASLVRKASSLQDAMDKMWNERWIYDGLNTIIDEQKNHSLYFYHLNADKGFPPGWDRSPESRDFYYLTRDLGNYSNFTIRLTDLLKFAWRTEELSEQIPETDKYRNEISLLVDSLNYINNEVLRTSKIFEDTRVELFGPSVLAEEITTEKMNVLRDSVKPYQRAITKLNSDYLTYKNRFLRINTSLYRIAKDESLKSSRKSLNYSRFAVFIYVIGSLLAIIGKWLDIKEKKNQKKRK